MLYMWRVWGMLSRWAIFVESWGVGCRMVVLLFTRFNPLLTRHIFVL
jgi:hypothetical protein